MDCPACDSPVTLEVGPEQPLSTSLPDAVLAAEEDERIEITRDCWDCWDCGWHETRQLRVESIDTTAGDETAVERAALLDNIMSEATAIDSLATLNDALAEVRRQRRLETAASGSPEDVNGE